MEYNKSIFTVKDHNLILSSQTEMSLQGKQENLVVVGGGEGVRLSHYFPLLICWKGTRKKRSDPNITGFFVMVRCVWWLWSPVPDSSVGKAPD